MVETQVTVELMRAISAAFNSRDVERIVAHFAEDAVFCLARGPEPVGRTLRGEAAISAAHSQRCVYRARATISLSVTVALFAPL
jgi:ketosteroid isomerase-like protein